MSVSVKEIVGESRPHHRGLIRSVLCFMVFNWEGVGPPRFLVLCGVFNTKWRRWAGLPFSTRWSAG